MFNEVYMQNKSFIVLESVEVLSSELGCAYLENTPVGVVILIDLFNFYEGNNYSCIVTDADGHTERFDFGENYIMRKLIDGFDVQGVVYVEIYMEKSLILRGSKMEIQNNFANSFFVKGENINLGKTYTEKEESEQQNRMTAREWAESIGETELLSEAEDIIKKAKLGVYYKFGDEINVNNSFVAEESFQADNYNLQKADKESFQADNYNPQRSDEESSSLKDKCVGMVENFQIKENIFQTEDNKTQAEGKSLKAEEESFKVAKNVFTLDEELETAETFCTPKNQDVVFSGCSSDCFCGAYPLENISTSTKKISENLIGETQVFEEDNTLTNKENKRISEISFSGCLDDREFINNQTPNDGAISYFDTIKEEFEMLFKLGSAVTLLQNHFGGEWRKVGFGDGMILAKIKLKRKGMDFTSNMPDIVALAMPCIVNKSNSELGKNAVVYKLNDYSDFGYNILFQDARNGKAIKIMENKC